MSPVIRADNLSKKYLIAHKRRESYLALRDVISAHVRRFGRRITHPFSTIPSTADAHEDFWALNDVSFEVFEGQSLGIIGRNGAGKSTLLKILSRITEPTRGRARIRGRVASLLEVGTGFHPELTGRENVFLNGAILGMSRAEIYRKFDEIVVFAGVEQFLDTPVKHYSSGMRVRLAFAVAAHLEPDILVVDEVLSVGDLDFQQKSFGKLEATAKEGRTVLCVSHDLGAIHRLCDRAILLNQGRIALDSSTDEVIKSYIASNRNARSVYEQDADPNKAINLRKVFLTNDEGQVATEFRYDERFSLTVEYEVNSAVSHCSVWFSVYSAERGLAFASADTDVDGAKLGPRTRGYYRAEISIPEKWLNDGTYFIILGITQYSPLSNFDRVEVLSFTILDVGTPERTRTGNSRPGMSQPYIPWRTQGS